MIRGGCLSANRLVHIPGAGDYQVESVSFLHPDGLGCRCPNTDFVQISAAGPSSITLASRPHQQANAMSVDSTTPLSVPDDAADDLTATNTPDLMANEQTWPTEEEMASAPGSSMGEGSKRTKRVPKGTSAYQAAWIVDDNDLDGDDDEDDEDEDEMEVEDDDEVAELGGGAADDADEDETEEIELDSRTEGAHRDMDADEEERE